MKQEIDAFLADGDPSDLEREVLADYHVSDEEHELARGKFVECIEGLGVGLTITFNAQGGYTISGVEKVLADYPDHESGNAAVDAMHDECERGTLGMIGMYYDLQQERLAVMSVVDELADCLAGNGAPESALGGEELGSLLVRGGTGVSVSDEFLACEEQVFPVPGGGGQSEGTVPLEVEVDG